ncbi:DUF2007 domain-containing protein [Dehalobacter sp. DCM]|uniref:putative signal transducing protein n=1 Tax=Dehalobacter sp. DCM TaxID=2907827 RepID=UPI003081DFF7|nr:DUF2007 domain-containing protein [Dehalobacter sp. DCM]
MSSFKKPEDNIDRTKWILITEANEVEADIIQSIFESEGIPSLKKYSDAGGEYLKVYLGKTNFGIDIYVPEELKDKAEAILTIDRDQEYLWPTD